MGPVVAPEGTFTVSCPKVTPVGAAVATPLKRTTGVPLVRFAPVIVTAVPGDPKFGEKPYTTGCRMKLLTEKPEPAGAVTRISPVVAFVGTVATMVLLLRTW